MAASKTARQISSTAESLVQSHRSIEKQLLDLASAVVGIGTVSGLVGGTFTCSSEAEKILGLQRNELLTRDRLLYLTYPEDRARLEKELNSVIDGRQPVFSVELRIVKKDGSVRWIHIWGTVQWDSLTELNRYLGAVMDITERKRIEQERETLVATISHDLRNPLSSAYSQAQLLLKCTGPIESKKTAIESIISSIDRVNKLVENVLNFSRAGMGRGFLERTQCDLGALLGDAISELERVHRRRFVYNSSGNFEGLWACHEIQRVLENLVNNAVAYGDPGAPVTISLSVSDIPGFVKLTVKNEGNPIALEEQAHIFEPGFRGKNVSQETKGWGLGLAAVRVIVKELGGTSDVESSPSNGTVFSITIPR
jgi:PAS domain S-box-containing protein